MIQMIILLLIPYQDPPVWLEDADDEENAESLPPATEFHPVL